MILVLVAGDFFVLFVADGCWVTLGALDVVDRRFLADSESGLTQEIVEVGMLRVGVGARLSDMPLDCGLSIGTGIAGVTGAQTPIVFIILIIGSCDCGCRNRRESHSLRVGRLGG